MLMKELISSCSHESIAQAAVTSIGRDFLSRVELSARSEGLSAGLFAARAVRDFKSHASADAWHELSQTCAGHDMPILRGLRHILESVLEENENSGRGASWTAGHPRPANQRLGSCCM